MTENYNLIYSYTREQAIEDGVLIDVSEMAREAGVKHPVAVTYTLWYGYIEPDPDAKFLGQSIEGRLWDVLWMFRVKAFVSVDSQFQFKVYFIMRKELKLAELKAVCGPGDNLEPVITIMLPEED